MSNRFVVFLVACLILSCPVLFCPSVLWLVGYKGVAFFFLKGNGWQGGMLRWFPQRNKGNKKTVPCFLALLLVC
jgi:hypothetical protein